MFLEALFVTVQNWKFKCLSTGEWRNDGICIYPFNATQHKKGILDAYIWINLQTMMKDKKSINMVWFHFHIIVGNSNESIVTKLNRDFLGTRGLAWGLWEGTRKLLRGGYVCYPDRGGFMDVTCQMVHIYSHLFKGVILVAGTWLWWKYLHQRNEQTLQHQGFFLGSWLLNIYRFTTSYNVHK